MNVKTFIDEATDAALKIDQANRQVDIAKEGVESARAALEASRAAVDTAKQGVTAAKEEFDSFAERAEQYGLTRSKFKDIVERMKSVLADIGAIEGYSDLTETTSAEPKQKVARKRKVDDTVEKASTKQVQTEGSTVAVGTNAEITVENSTSDVSPDETQASEGTNIDTTSTSPLTLRDEDVHSMADRIANNPEVMEALAALETDNAEASSTDGEAEVEAVADGAVPDIADIANILRREPETVVLGETKDENVIAEVAKVVEAHTTTSTSIETEDNDDELDNNVAEQELLDFVDEVGTSDNDVKSVLTAAIKVVAWHTTNVAKAPLRTQPSPLTLAGVHAVEDAGYAPKDIQEQYKIALTFGGEKLAAAISWFNKALDLLADAKPVEDFRFAEPVKSARAKKEDLAEVVTPQAQETLVEMHADDNVSAANDALDEVIDATDAGLVAPEKIEDIQLFAEPDTKAEVSVEPAPEVSKPEEKPVTTFTPRVSKPSWL
jgi:hypothetical protein